MLGEVLGPRLAGRRHRRPPRSKRRPSIESGRSTPTRSRMVGAMSTRVTSPVRRVLPDRSSPGSTPGRAQPGHREVDLGPRGGTAPPPARSRAPGRRTRGARATSASVRAERLAPQLGPVVGRRDAAGSDRPARGRSPPRAPPHPRPRPPRRRPATASWREPHAERGGRARPRGARRTPRPPGTVPVSSISAIARRPVERRALERGPAPSALAMTARGTPAAARASPSAPISAP